MNVPSYNKLNKTLSIKPFGLLKFDDFRSIHFGNSQTDLNLCDPKTYTYIFKSGKAPSLSGTSTSFTISNRAKVLPDLLVTMKMLSPTIVNIKWTF